MHMGVNLVKNSTQLIPTELWKLVLKNNTYAALGVASTALEGFIQTSADEGVTLELIESFQKEHQKDTILFHLLESTDKLMPEDIQPFFILNEEKDKMAVFFDGDFSSFKEDKDPHTGEYHAASYLREKVEDMYASARGDMAKVLDRMRDKMFTKEVNGVIGTSNSVIVLASVGEIMRFGKAAEAERFPWGMATNYYGYSEAAPAAKEEKAKGLSKIFGKKIADAKAADPAPRTLQAQATDEGKKVVTAIDKGPTISDLATKTETAVVEDRELWIQPASDLGQNKLSNWYHRFVPGMPREQWLKKPAIKVKASQLLKFNNWKEVAEPKGMEKLQEYMAFASQAAEQPVKDVEPKHIPENTPATPVEDGHPKPSIVETIPRIPADEAKKLVAIVQGIRKTPNPESFKEMERKYPTFLQTVGLNNWDQMYGYSFDDFLSIAKNPIGAAKMLQNLMGQVIRLNERLDAVGKEAVKKIAM